MLYTARNAGSMLALSGHAFVSIRLYYAALVRATREAGSLGEAMGAREETWLKRDAPRVFALLPAAALSSLLAGLAPAATGAGRTICGRTRRSSASSDDAEPEHQARRPRKAIADAETSDIQRDPPAKAAAAGADPAAHAFRSALAPLRDPGPDRSRAAVPCGALYPLSPRPQPLPIATGLAEPGTATYALAIDAAERDYTFDEVDQLAAQGAFGEAIHRLLLLVQERLRSRIEHGFQSSLTSREILRRARLAGEAKTAFASLVAAVEITLFGQQAANLATYQLCRDSSRRVLEAAA